MFQNDQLKKLTIDIIMRTGLMEHLELSRTTWKNRFSKNISKVLEIGAGSAPHIKYIKHNFDEYHIIDIDFQWTGF